MNPLLSVRVLPNPTALAQHLRNAADETERFEHLPVLNVAQTLNQILTAIAGLTNQVSALATQITAVETQMNNKLDALETRMNNRMDAMETRINARIDIKFRIMDSNQLARAYNNQQTNFNHELEPIKTFANEVPIGFPTNGEMLTGLTGRQLDRLLTAYELPINGDLHEKRKSFRRFVGIIRDY